MRKIWLIALFFCWPVLADNIEFNTIAERAQFLGNQPEVKSLIERMSKEGWSFYGFLDDGRRAFGDAYTVDLFFVKYDRECPDMIKPQLTTIVKMEVRSPNNPDRRSVSVTSPGMQSSCRGRTERLRPDAERVTIQADESIR